MVTQVPISAVPNQSFTITLDNNLFDITIRYTNGVMAMSLTINGIDTIDNIRVVAGSPVIPSQYQEVGNFLFLTQNFQLPIYTQFNVTQSLIYASASELATYRAIPTSPITAADFNSIAGLPLRFQPVGYAT